MNLLKVIHEPLDWGMRRVYLDIRVERWVALRRISADDDIASESLA